MPTQAMTNKLTRTTTRSLGFTLAAGLAVAAAGCEVGTYINPSDPVDPRPENALRGGTPLVVPILEEIDFGLSDQQSYFTQARKVEQDDLTADNSDYQIGANDTLSVSISGLNADGSDAISTRRVSASGSLPLPLLERPVPVDGLTEPQAQSAIADAYRDAQILRNPQVQVTVVESRNRIFTISGAVPQPGSYGILERNFRLTNALTLAGNLGANSGVEYAYIIRYTDDDEAGGEMQNDDPQRPRGVDPLAPQSRLGNLDDTTASRRLSGPTWEAVFSQDARDGDGASDAAIGIDAPDAEGRVIQIDGRDVAVDETPADFEVDMGGDEADFEVEMLGDDEMPEPALEPLADLPGEQRSFDFPELEAPPMVVIEVPIRPLLLGRYEYNVAVRPGDQIVVAAPRALGQYYMSGHVNAPGVYALNGQKVTVTQAVAAARMLDQLAIPARSKLVRRQVLPNGEEVEVHARIDLAKIFAGKEPNIYLHPNDEIRVGTNFAAPWIATLRNAFRLTYGFGFLYDRNFARDDDDRF